MQAYCNKCDTVHEIKDVNEIKHHSYLPLSWGRGVYWLNCPNCGFEWCGAMAGLDTEDLILMIEYHLQSEYFGIGRKNR